MTCETETYALPFEMEQLSVAPSIWLAHDFLTDAECQHLIDAARASMRPSTVISGEDGSSVLLKDKRTSTNTFLKKGLDPVVSAIERRIAEMLRIPVENGEDLQMLNYQIGQEYIPHNDFFIPTVPNIEREYYRGGQRLATVLMYLNDVEEGGETAFPRINLTITPKKGLALIFYNLFENGAPDYNTLHAARPVIRGEKWAATKWLRERRFNPQGKPPGQ